MRRLVDLVSSPTQRGEWYWWYDDLLRKVGLHVEANEVAVSSQGVDDEEEVVLVGEQEEDEDVDEEDDDNGDDEDDGDGSRRIDNRGATSSSAAQPNANQQPQSPAPPAPPPLKPGSLAAANTNSTSVHAQCGSCRKPIATTTGKRGQNWCTKCRQPLST
jgi:hypothetical protein